MTAPSAGRVPAPHVLAAISHPQAKAEPIVPAGGRPLGRQGTVQPLILVLGNDKATQGAAKDMEKHYGKQIVLDPKEKAASLQIKGSINKDNELHIIAHGYGNEADKPAVLVGGFSPENLAAYLVDKIGIFKYEKKIKTIKLHACRSAKFAEELCRAVRQKMNNNVFVTIWGAAGLCVTDLNGKSVVLKGEVKYGVYEQFVKKGKVGPDKFKSFLKDNEDKDGWKSFSTH